MHYFGATASSATVKRGKKLSLLLLHNYVFSPFSLPVQLDEEVRQWEQCLPLLERSPASLLRMPRPSATTQLRKLRAGLVQPPQSATADGPVPVAGSQRGSTVAARLPLSPLDVTVREPLLPLVVDRLLEAAEELFRCNPQAHQSHTGEGDIPAGHHAENGRGPAVSPSQALRKDSTLLPAPPPVSPWASAARRSSEQSDASSGGRALVVKAEAVELMLVLGKSLAGSTKDRFDIEKKQLYCVVSS